MAFSEKDIARRRTELQHAPNSDRFKYQKPDVSAPVNYGSSAPSSQKRNGNTSGSSTKVTGNYTEEAIARRRKELQHGGGDRFAYKGPDFSVLPAPKFNPFNHVNYTDPVTQKFHQQTGWRDPGTQALYELVERTRNPQRKITPASTFQSGPIAGSNIGPRSRSFEAANRAAEAEKEAAEQAAAGIQFDRSEAVKRRQSNIIPPETIESITDQYDMRPSYMRQQGDLPAAQDDRTRKALEQIYNSPIRVNQDNPIVEGFVRGTGIPSVITAGVNAVGAATGDQDMRNRMNREYAAYLQQSQQLAENHPFAYGAGNIAGNIALMSGIGKVIGAGAGAINTASTAGRAALRMGASALNFAATTAIQEAGAAAGGFTTPDNYARDVLVSGGAGMASAVASMAVAGGLEKVLSKSGLGGQYVFLDYLKNLSSATAGAGARVGVDYAAINKAPTDAFRQAFISNHPGSTEEDVQKAYVNSLRQRAGEQFVTAFVFNLISSYMDTLRSTERAHYDLQREYDELEQVMEAYGKNPPRNAAEAAQWANDVHTEAGRVRSRLNNGYYAGQQDKIDKILPLLDEIDERANQWASNYSGISGPAPSPEPTPEFVQEIGAAMQQGAENPPAVINPDEPIQAPAAQESQPSTTDLLSEIANTPMPAEEEPIVPPAVNTNVDNINAGVDESVPETVEETSVADERRKKAQEWFDEIDTFINEEQEIPAATEEDLPTTKENVPTTEETTKEKVPTTEVAAPTTETTVPTTEEVAPVEEKAPQETVQQEEKPAETTERTTTDMLQEIANTEYEAPAAEEAQSVAQPRVNEIQAPAVEAQKPASKTPEAPKPVVAKKEFATEEASKLSADLFRRKRVDQNGLRYTIRGDDGQFFGSIERIGAGNVKNSRDTIYNVGPKATLQEVADDLAEVAEKNGFLTVNEEKAPEPKQPEVTNENTTVAKTGTPQAQIAESVKAMLESGKEFTVDWLYGEANKAFGGTMAEGAYTVKDAYDGMELAINKYLMSADFVKNGNGSLADAKKTLTSILRVMSKIPAQNKRTEEQELFQQYSTPPNIAYTAARMANINKDDIVLEPSAGIGGLALWGKAWGAKVYGNELSERRLAFLNELGLDGTFNENAEQINNVLPDNIKPTVVIMNPPFSATAGRMTKNATKNATRHITQALDRLEDGGRLVAILGRGMSNDSPSFKKWWDEIRQDYTVRANVRIDGSNYKKYGTTFDDQLVVIDKIGPQTGETITGEYKNLSELLTDLEGVRDARTQLEGRNTEPDRLVSGSGNDSGQRDGGALPGGRNSGRNGGVAAGQRSGIDSGTDGGSGRNRRGVLGGSNTSDNGRPGTAGERPESGVSGGRTGESGSGNAGQTDNTVRLVPGSVQRPRVKKINLDSTFTEYVPAKVNIAGAKPHPGRLAESAAMGAVSPPDATYTPHLSQSLIDTGRPSIAQLENVVYAGQAHSQMLPDGSRKGYFIGDGTGVGKGIQIASIILDNFNQGRRKALWISKGQNLYEDAQRDWKDLGGNPKEIYSLSKVKKTNDIPYGDGILFGTYDTLGSRKEEGIKKLQKWLGKDFDGVIAMDEAHGMAGGAPVKGSRGTKKPSQKALWGIELQKAFPNARIVYASATGASSPENMVYLQRLGLWGKGTAFTDFNDFYSKISSGGLAAMELVARDMKAMGVYLARSISYDDVTYDTLEHDLTPIQTDIYNKMSDAWQVVLRDINKALKITGGDKPGGGKGAAYSAFWGSLQRFYNQIITSMSMPSVIEDIKAELANGRSVVIQLTKTNAAQADRAIEKNAMEGGDLEDLDLTPSEELINMVKKSFPVQAYEEYTDDEGNVRVRPVVDSNGKPVEDKKAVELREQLIAEIGQMQVPDGPLEMLLDAFGTDQVAEVTGRTRRVVYKKQADGSMKRVIEKRGDAASLADANAFQDGKKRILVFSEKGGTGKSYHADLRAKNQQQRVHYLLQPGWKADAAIQGLGRTHRTNQASAPIYKLVTTNVMGQKRFTSTIARRLNQMGALTKGQRDAGSGVFSEKDNLENPIAMDALASYYKSAPDDMIRKLGIKIKDANGKINESADDLRNISKFLNRILALHVDEQNQVFEDFYAILEQMTDAAVANGTIDRGMENYKADKIELIDEKTVRKDPSGADTKYVQMKTYNKPKLIKYSRLPDAHRGYMGLYRLDDGSVRAVYDIGNITDRYGTVSRKFRLDSPAKEKFSTYVERTLKEKATKIPKSEWESAWEEETKKLPQYDESTLHLLTGTLLPIWDKLPENNTRVMRVVTSDGNQYLGRVINPDQIDSVLRGLGANRTVKKYSSDEVFKEVLDNGREAALRDNKWKINRRRVSGEWRLEVTGNNVWSLPKYVPGIITEKINYQFRYFIPTGDKGKEVLAKLLEFNPVVDVRTSSSSEIQQLKGLDSATDYASQWEATRVGDTNKAPMSLNDLIRRIRHDLGLSITTGHIRGKGVRGQFNTHDQGIRTKIANDLPALAHEVGHYFDLEYDIITDGLSNDIKNELYEALRKGLGDNANKYRKDQRDSEGFAEYIRQYMQNREEAAIAYPKLTEHLKSKLSARELSQINNIADEINAYYSLDADNAQSSIRLREEGGRDFRTIREKIRDIGDDLYQTWIDSNHSIKRFDDAMGGHAYKLASNAAYSDAVAGQLIVGDLTDVNGKYVGPGLKEALHGIDLTDRPTYIAFNEYLVCRHGQTWLEDGKRIFADDRKNSIAFMQRRVEELEAQHENFKEAADRLVDFVQRFTQTWGVNTGLISQDTLDKWNEKYPNYVPMYRMMEKGTPGAKRGFANQNSPYKRAKGSGLDIMAPVDGIIDQIVRVTNTALRNNVMLEMRRAYQKSPDADANFISPVPTPLRPKKFDMTGMKAQLAGDISDAMLSGNIKMSADSAKELGSIIDSINDVMLQFERGRAKDNVVTILVNGKKEYWQVNDKKLLESIGNMNPAKIGGLLEAYAKTTRFLTANITGNNPIWSIFSNAPRDLGTFLVYSKSNKDKLSQISKIGTGWINSVNANLRDGKNVDPLYSEYLAMGGGWTSAYSADADLAKKARKKLTSNKAARTMDTMNPLNWVSFMTDTIEQGPRFATYKLLRESGLSPQEAFYEAMDVTVNFRKAGTMSRQVNKVVPFFNAGLQGADKFARYFSADDVVGPNRGKAAAGRFGAWAAASMILAALTYALNGRDEEKRKEYSQLSNYTKNNFWCIPLGNGQYFAIPKPRELAAMTSFAESAMDFTVGKNEHAFDEYYDYATDVFLPGIVSDLAQLPVHAVRDGLDSAVTEFSDRAIGSLGIIGAFHDLSANRDFLGRSIVSKSLESYEPKDQFTRATSKAAYWIGRGLNYSPQKIDYLGNQVLGYWWKIQKALFPVGEEYVDHSLGVKNTYFKDNVYSQDLVNWIYDSAEKSARKYKSSQDPKDGIRAKNDDNMKKFYANFYRISKDLRDRSGPFSERQLVLDMINDYRSFTDHEILTPVQEAVYGVVERTNNMELLPGVMKTEIKTGETSVELAPITYVQYQTGYNETYWKYIEDNLDVTASDSQQASVISAAKKIAQAKAAKRAALFMGVTDYDVEDSKAEQWVDDGGDLSVWMDFEAARKEGKQDGAAEWLNNSSLSDEEKWALWELAGWSEKTFDKKVN